MIFKNEFGFLSNFYFAPFKTRTGIEWPTVEHAYQAAKSLNQADWYRVLAEEKPGRVKRIGRTFEIQPDWNRVRVGIMQTLVFLKFSQNPSLADKLIKINEEIVEHNSWHDNFWGSCQCQKCRRKAKENMLGKILMKTAKMFY